MLCNIFSNKITFTNTWHNLTGTDMKLCMQHVLFSLSFCSQLIAFVWSDSKIHWALWACGHEKRHSNLKWWSLRGTLVSDKPCLSKVAASVFHFNDVCFGVYIYIYFKLINLIFLDRFDMLVLKIILKK
jgi:hypothetical protein